MSTTSLDVTTVRPRHLLPWATMLGGLVTGVATGVLTAKSLLVTATDSENKRQSQPESACRRPGAGSF